MNKDINAKVLILLKQSRQDILTILDINKDVLSDKEIAGYYDRLAEINEVACYMTAEK